MTPVALSSMVFVLICAGTLVGLLLNQKLPSHHLSKESQETVKLGIGLVATMSALVLGLLIASAKSSYDTKSSEINQITADVIMLDAALKEYGPESRPAREAIRQALDGLIERIWLENASISADVTPFEISTSSQIVYQKIQELKPIDEGQRAHLARATQALSNIAQARLLLYVQRTNSLPLPFLTVLVLWLVILFASFSMFGRPNATLITSQLIFALSASAAIFLILELSQPFIGLLTISSEPLRHALGPLA